MIVLFQHSRLRISGWNSEHTLPILDLISELKDEAGSELVGGRDLSKPLIVTTRISPASEIGWVLEYEMVLREFSRFQVSSLIQTQT